MECPHRWTGNNKLLLSYFGSPLWMANDMTKIRKKIIISLILGCCFGFCNVTRELQLPFWITFLLWLVLFSLESKIISMQLLVWQINQIFKQVPVVQRSDNAFYRINHYPLDKGFICWLEISKLWKLGPVVRHLYQSISRFSYCCDIHA